MVTYVVHGAARTGVENRPGYQSLAHAGLPGVCSGNIESTISPPLTARMERRVSLSYGRGIDSQSVQSTSLPACNCRRSATTHPVTILAAALQPDPTTVGHGIFAEREPVVPCHGIPVVLEQVPRRFQQFLMSIPLIPRPQQNQIKA